MHKLPSWLTAIIVGSALAFASSVSAATFTWTNSTSGHLSDFWTNNSSWLPATSQPGAANTADLVLMTNAYNFAYTNILDVSPANPVNTIAVSNAQGEAWLVVTNGAILNNSSTLSIGSGGRIEIDSGSVITQSVGGSVFQFRGTNGVLYLNGGKLSTPSTVNFGSVVGGVTGLVTSTTGQGGFWVINNQQFNIGVGATGNVLSITGGATVTNIGSLTLTGNLNSLLVTNGGLMYGTGSITFGAGAGNTVLLGGGAWDSTFNWITMAASANSSNNTFLISSTTVSNVGSINIGSGVGANNNLLMTTNGGSLIMASPAFNKNVVVGATLGGGVGGSGNTVILSNSILLTYSQPAQGGGWIGSGSSNNTVVLLGGTSWLGSNDALVGRIRVTVGTGQAYNNQLLISGGVMSNFTSSDSTLVIGGSAGAISNKVVVDNGGMLAYETGLAVGGAVGATYNSLIVTGSGRYVAAPNGVGIYVGSAANAGNGANGGGNNFLLMTNSVISVGGGVTDYIGNGSSNNQAILQGSTFTSSGTLVVGGNAAVSNQFLSDGSTLSIPNIFVGVGGSPTNFNNAFIGNNSTIFFGNMVVGFSGGASNSLTLNGSVASNTANGTVLVGNGAGSRNNLLVITNSKLFTSGTINVGNTAGTVGNQIYVGAGGVITNTGFSVPLWVGNAVDANGNSFVVTNGGAFYMLSTGGSIGTLLVGATSGGGAGGSSNYVILANSFVRTAPTVNYVGSGGTNNSVTLMSGASWDFAGTTANSGILGELVVGFNGGVGNLVDVNGGILSNLNSGSLKLNNLKIGVGTNSSGNQIIVENGGVVTNVAGLVIGAGVNANFNSMIVTNGGRFIESSVNSNAAILLGSSDSYGAAGGSFNVAIFSNSVLAAETQASVIGGGSSNNAMTILANTIWDNNARTLTIGIGSAVSNSLTLNSGTMVNMSSLIIGSGGGVTNNNNSVLVTNTGRLLTSSIVVGTGGSRSNSLVIDGGISSAVASNLGTVLVGDTGSSYNSASIANGKMFVGGTLTVGGGLGAVGNQLLVNSGGLFTNAASVTIFALGSAVEANGNSVVSTNGGNFYWNNTGGNSVFVIGSTSLGAAGGSSNLLSLANGFIHTHDTAFVGSGSTNNQVVIGPGGVWDFGGSTINNLIGGSLILGTNGAVGNVFNVNGGIISNLNAYSAQQNNLRIGIGVNSISNQMIVQNGGIISNFSGLVVGGGAGSAYNSFIVTNGGRALEIGVNRNSAVLLGSADTNGTAGGGFNTIIISNSVLAADTLPSVIGGGSSNNSMTVLGNTTWDNNSKNLWIGMGSAVSNSLTINGGTVANIIPVVGSGGGATNSGNSLIIQGGQLTAATVTIGTGGSRSNALIVTGGVLTNPAGSTIVIGDTGSSYNQFLISGSGKVFNTGTLGIGAGAGASGNLMTIGAGGLYSNAAFTLSFLMGSGVDANGNGLVATNGGFYWASGGGAGPFVIGATSSGGSGGSSNFLMLANGSIRSKDVSFVGSGGTNNSVTLLTNGVWDVNGSSINNSTIGALIIGTNGAVGTVFDVNGGILSNANGATLAQNNLKIGVGANSISNQMLVRNGGLVTNVSGLQIGGSIGAAYNSLIVTGGGRFVESGGNNDAAVLLGSADSSGTAGGGNNTVILSNSTLAASAAGVIGGGSSNNLMTLLANTRWDNGVQAFTIGIGAAVSNIMIVNSGSLGNFTSMLVGSGAATGNSLIITNGGFVAALALSAGGGGNNTIFLGKGAIADIGTLSTTGTGNSISNAGGMYEFVASPSASAGTAGSIVLDSGTISYKGLSLANVNANMGSGNLSGIRFLGTNTFMINNGSNLSIGGSQTYTFDVVSGNPSNYANLAMVNGFTTYGGGNVTIGTAGSLLVSNTVATFTGTFINNGFATLVSSTDSFQLGFLNQGTVTNYSDNTWYGALTMNNGTVVTAGGSLQVYSSNIVLQAAGTFDTSGGSLTLAGVLSGTGSLSKIGANILTLKATNSYTGTTTVNGGQLVLGHGLAITNSTLNVNAGNGIVFSNGTGFLIGGLTGTGTLDLENTDGAAIILSNGNNNTDTIFGGILGGIGGLTKIGSGTLTVTNNSTYTGPTLISSGTVQIGAGTAGGLLGSGVITNLATLVFDRSDIFTNVSSIAGTGKLIQNGLGSTLVLVSNNPYTGNTLVSNGTLRLTGVLAGTGDVIVASAGAFTGTGVVSGRVFNAGLIVADSTPALRLMSNVFNQVSGVITAGNAGLEIGGLFTNAGTVVMVNSASTFDSPTVLNRGTISLNASSLAAPGSVITNDTLSTIALNNGTIEAEALINLGNLALSGGMISNGLSNTSSGYVNTFSGVTKVTELVANFGVITNSATLQGLSSITNGALLYMNGGTVTASQITNTALIAGHGTVGGALWNNSGVVTATNGELKLSGTASGAGLYQAVMGLAPSTLTFAGGGLVGSLLNTGSTIKVASILTNTASLFVNEGTVAAVNGTYVNLGDLQNDSGKVITANNGGLIVNGVFTNSGTLSFVGSVGTFNGVVVNNGAWQTDPSTNLFNSSFTVSANGFIGAGAGDVYMFRSNFVNVSTNRFTYNTSAAKFVFDGGTNVTTGASYTQAFYVAGLNLAGAGEKIQSSNEVYFTTPNGTFSTNTFTFYPGESINGVNDNFALGTLEVGNAGTNSTLSLMDSFGIGEPGSNDNQVAGLYVNSLVINPGSLLIISNNVELFFRYTNGVTGISFDPNNLAGANVLLLNNSSFHQLIMVPEPSVLVLWISGAFAVYLARRRRRLQRVATVKI